MADASYQMYEDISSHPRLREMIADGETEGLHLECKAPGTPRVTKDLKVHLGKALSGFSNTAGGVVILGVSTTKHRHSGLDVLTQIETLGNVKHFEGQVRRAIPTLATPPAFNTHTKVLKRRPSDTSGVVIVHIPKGRGDPIQSTQDNVFYFRSGDGFSVAPYEMIKRLFSATETPDLHAIFMTSLVKTQKDGKHVIPILLRNESSAIGENVKMAITINNATACETIKALGFTDQSDMNPGMRIYISKFSGVVHRGLNKVIGKLHIKMAKGQRPKRRLDISIRVFANKMVARGTDYTAQLTKKGFSIRKVSEEDLY